MLILEVKILTLSGAPTLQAQEHENFHITRAVTVATNAPEAPLVESQNYELHKLKSKL